MKENENHSIVTIKDIAQRLKLSVSTVSRALRNSTEIREETRRMVKELAKELHYSPNPIALSLKEKKSKIIGVVVPEIANNFCSATIAGIEDVAYKNGYHVAIVQSHETYEREVINTQLLVSRRVDGLIVSVSNETHEYGHLAEIIEKGIPLVMFDRVCEEIQTHKVIVNDYQGAYDATMHLIDEGYTRIAHLTISKYLSITRSRLQGYTDALKARNIPVRDEWIFHCDFKTSSVDEAIHTLFSGNDRPNAILASVERIAIGCLQPLKEMQLRIPQDVALVGFSDNPINQFMNPSLTTVQQPTFDMGQKAAELLLKLIETKNRPKKFQTITLNTFLDVRDSSRGKG